jgi:hypothetical protein
MESGCTTLRLLLGLAMILNAVVFFCCAAGHLGFGVGPFQEPRILPAAIVELVCGVLLVWGTVTVFSRSRNSWRVALILNLAVLGFVGLGVFSLVRLFGAHRAIHDLCHRIMLVLLAISLLVLFFRRSALNGSQKAAPPP